MPKEFKPRGKKKVASNKIISQKSKHEYGTKKQAYIVSINGRKTAYTVGVSGAHKGPLMHIGVNPPTSDPPPPSPGKKEFDTQKIVVGYKIARGNNTTKVVKRKISSQAARRLRESYNVKKGPGGQWKKK